MRLNQPKTRYRKPIGSLSGRWRVVAGQENGRYRAVILGDDPDLAIRTERGLEAGENAIFTGAKRGVVASLVGVREVAPVA